MEDINAGIDADIQEDNDEVESDVIMEKLDREGSQIGNKRPRMEQR